jgi:hypothetical protein
MTLEQVKKLLPHEMQNRFKKWEDFEKFMKDQGIDTTECFVEVKDVRKTKALRRDALDKFLEALNNVPTTGFIPLPPGSNVVPIKKVI